MQFQEVLLSKIKFSKLNPRTAFDTPEDAELEASIKISGVIQPVLLRPVNKYLEVVAGERRIRAANKIAKTNGGLDKNTIPAIIKKLTDDQAFDPVSYTHLTLPTTPYV